MHENIAYAPVILSSRVVKAYKTTMSKCAVCTVGTCVNMSCVSNEDAKGPLLVTDYATFKLLRALVRTALYISYILHN